MPTITVNLPPHAAQILIEPGVLARLGALTASVAPHPRALLAVDANVASDHGRTARASLEAAGYDVAVLELIADEEHKTLDSVRAMYEVMLAHRLDRGSPVVALGGGVVGDTAAFAAATFLRGVPVVQAPTTLLAMVDASIGGKTGVNFPLPPRDSGDEAGAPRLGKNLVGAFWQPRAIVTDPEVLRTLPARELRCGLAECVKHGLVADAELLEFIEANASRFTALVMAPITELIARSARIKVRIVEEDEREAGRRALLNLGHTFAHVIEPIPELDLRHGEAVAIGLRAAAVCAAETGRCGTDLPGRVTGLLAELGLPVALPLAVDPGPLIEAMAYDKKVEQGRLRLVLPAAPGAAEVVDDVPVAIIESAWHAVGARRADGAPGKG